MSPRARKLMLPLEMQVAESLRLQTCAL